MPGGIIVFGLNGCGKTTVGRELAKRLRCKHMDVEDYYFPPAEIPFSVSRTRDEVRQMMLEEINKHSSYVLSSVSCDWGEEIMDTFGLAVLLSAPPEVRLERIRRRDVARFGARVLEGGDLCEQQQRFYTFAASRTEDKVRGQAAMLPCPLLELDATLPVKETVEIISGRLLTLIVDAVEEKHAKSG